MAAKRPLLPTRQASRLLCARVAVRGQRRLPDKIRVAFHIACDEQAVEMAERLLGQLDELIHRRPVLPAGIDRRQPESLVALFERLANLLLWLTQTGWVGCGLIP